MLDKSHAIPVYTYYPGIQAIFWPVLLMKMWWHWGCILSLHFPFF